MTRRAGKKKIINNISFTLLYIEVDHIVVFFFFYNFTVGKITAEKLKTLDPKIVQAFLSTPTAVNKTLRIILSLLLFQRNETESNRCCLHREIILKSFMFLKKCNEAVF